MCTIATRINQNEPGGTLGMSQRCPPRYGPAERVAAQNAALHMKRVEDGHEQFNVPVDIVNPIGEGPVSPKPAMS